MKKTKTYIYILFISFITFLAFIFMEQALKGKTVYHLEYNEEKALDYRVYLKDNTYYDNIYLDKDMQYVTELINYIDGNFRYKFNIKEKNKVTSSYYIKANVKVEDNKSKKSIFNKDIMLKGITIKSAYNSFEINETVKIDYNLYNDIVNEFIEEYKIDTPYSSYLTIGLYILNDYGIEKTENLENTPKSIEMIMPLGNKTTDITIIDKNIKEKNVIEKISYDEYSNKIMFIISIIFIIIDIIVLINLFISIKNNDFNNRQYQKILKKILKKYDKDIVSVNSIPDVRGYDVYDVVSFDELLDVKKNINKPIMHIVLKNGDVNLFFITKNNNMYEYMMRKKK